MSIIFFTNTNDAGEGSLRQAIADAVDGDVVTTDPAVFRPGDVPRILLSSHLTINKSITIKPHVRIILDAGNATRCAFFGASSVDSHVYNVTFTNGYADVNSYLDALGGCVRLNGSATFERCEFVKSASNSTIYSGVFVNSTSATFKACVFQADAGRALHATRGNLVNVVRCTFIESSSVSTVNITDSIYMTQSKAVDECVNYDGGNYHLKPSSIFATGSTDTTTAFDCDGNPYRTDGTGSLGAFENYDVDGMRSIFWRGANAAGRADNPANWSAERFGASLEAFPDDLGSYTARLLEPSNVVLNGDATEAGSASALPCPVVIGGFCSVENINEEATTAAVSLSEGSFLTIGPEVVLNPRRISSDVENVGVALEGRATLQGNCLVKLDEVDLKAGGQLVVKNGPSVNSYTVPGGALLELAPDAEYTPTIASLELAGSLIVRAARCSIWLLKIPTGATGAALFITAPSGWSTAVDAKASLTVETSTAFDDGAVVYLSSVDLADGANVILNNPSNVLFSVPLNADLSRFLNADGGALCETVARRGASVSRVTASSVGSQCLLNIERDGTGGDYLVQTCPALRAPYQFEGRNLEGFKLKTAEGYNVRIFDGEAFKEGFCARKYYFVGDFETGGDFKNKSDWSLTDGGVVVDAIPTIKEGVFIVE